MLGQDVNISNQVSIGVENVAARNLGSNALDSWMIWQLGKNQQLGGRQSGRAQKIVDNAISQSFELARPLGSVPKEHRWLNDPSIGCVI